MFFTPPELSDDTAYELCEFFHNFVMRLESHYGHQLRRCFKEQEAKYLAKEQEDKYLSAENQFYDDEMPF